MGKSTLSDSPDEPVPVAAQTHSAVSTITPNNAEDAELALAASSMDRNDMELNDARRAVILITADDPEWLNRSRALASLLWKRFQESNRDTLAECIAIQRRICALCATGSPERAASVFDLALSLRAQFNQTSEALLLAEAVDLNREALSLRPSGHPDRSISCDSLAATLQTQFNETGEEAQLIEAIELHREALSLQPNGHPGRAKSCNNLALALGTRFEQIGEESLLAEAVDLQREALSLRPRGHPLRSISCSNLAISLKARFERTAEESLLAEAIDLQREAISLRPSGHPNRSLACNNLALSLLARFWRTGEESLLAEAIDLNREALLLRPSGHPFRSTSLNNLAISLRARFEQTGEEYLLNEVIDLHKEALSLRPKGHPDRSGSCINLALALWTRFKHIKEQSLLTEAIDFSREALYLQPIGHHLRLESCGILSISLKAWFEVTGDESLLTEAIDLIKETLETQPQNHPSRWQLIINLIHIYLNRRFSRYNLILAINYLQQALSVPSDNWPTLLSEVTQVVGLVDLPHLPPDSLSLLLRCLSSTIDLASRVAGFVLDPQSQLRYLRDSQHLGPRAYWCAVACRRPQLGLELIERARAMMWTQALNMRNPQLSGAPRELVSELELLLSSMNTSRTSLHLSSIENDRRHKNSARIHDLIHQIRSISGNEGFMRGLPFEELVQSASRNAVVVLIAIEGECHALILQSSNPQPLALKLSNIAPNELTEMSFVVSAAQRRGSAQTNVHDDDRGMKALHYRTSSDQKSWDPLLEKLWITVVKPVINHLRLHKASGSSRPRLHWCPTGTFMFLPLHAAGIYGTNNAECCADYVVCSYTPTLTALLRAQKSNPSFHRRNVKLGLVAAMEAWDATLPALWYVKDEIKYVHAAAEKARISVDDSQSRIGELTTAAHVSDVFEGTNLVHIACHGTQNTADPLSSGFCLSDSSLTVSRLMNLDLKDAFFAFLSACETAKGDEKQPDQTVHLAAAMLFVGFRSVVATLWAMNDADGPLVAKLFYERLFAEDVITLDAIPYALDYAVAELRKSGVSPERWATFIHMGA